MIHRIWLLQPLAFARVGTSETPLDAFRWTQPDLRPRGSGRTAIAPGPSFTVDSNGVLQRRPDGDAMLFKDEDGLRPVCPFFELHGQWDGQGDSTALTPRLLREDGFSLQDLTWSIRHANLKAYVLTHCEGDRIEACLTIHGDEHDRRPLIGRSPDDAKNPLVPPDRGIEMGALQVVRPASEHDAIRLRFYAPKGHAYAPTNLTELITRKSGLLDYLLAFLNAKWARFSLPQDRCILNPEASWPNHKFITCRELVKELPRLACKAHVLIALGRSRAMRSELLRFLLPPTADAGKLPPSLFAWRYGGGAPLSSLGVIDDMGDGIIQCTLRGLAPAYARIVVCPPHFAPDRRPPVSVADNFADRTARREVRADDWADAYWLDAEAAIDDLLDRAFETAGLSNLDVWNEELRAENKSAAVYRNEPDRPVDPSALLWSDLDRDTLVDLPLTERARWHHRRNAADEFFEQRIRDNPDAVERWMRNPDDAQAMYYDQRMPALMRGSDRLPLHLTRRQLEVLRRWAARLRQISRPGP